MEKSNKKIIWITLCAVLVIGNTNGMKRKRDSYDDSYNTDKRRKIDPANGTNPITPQSAFEGNYRKILDELKKRKIALVSPQAVQLCNTIIDMRKSENLKTKLVILSIDNKNLFTIENLVATDELLSIFIGEKTEHPLNEALNFIEKKIEEKIEAKKKEIYGFNKNPYLSYGKFLLSLFVEACKIRNNFVLHITTSKIADIAGSKEFPLYKDEICAYLKERIQDIVVYNKDVNFFYQEILNGKLCNSLILATEDTKENTLLAKKLITQAILLCMQEDADLYHQYWKSILCEHKWYKLLGAQEKSHLFARIIETGNEIDISRAEREFEREIENFGPALCAAVAKQNITKIIRIIRINTRPNVGNQETASINAVLANVDEDKYKTVDVCKSIIMATKVKNPEILSLLYRGFHRKLINSPITTEMANEILLTTVTTRMGNVLLPELTNNNINENNNNVANSKTVLEKVMQLFERHISDFASPLLAATKNVESIEGKYAITTLLPKCKNIAYRNNKKINQAFKLIIQKTTEYEESEELLPIIPIESVNPEIIQEIIIANIEHYKNMNNFTGEKLEQAANYDKTIRLLLERFGAIITSENLKKILLAMITTNKAVEQIKILELLEKFTPEKIKTISQKDMLEIINVAIESTSYIIAEKLTKYISDHTVFYNQLTYLSDYHKFKDIE